MPQDHRLPGFNFTVEELDAKGQTYETLAICRTLVLARAGFEVAINEPTGIDSLDRVSVPAGA